MCCFSPLSPLGWIGRLFWSRPLEVKATRIFARLDGDEQVLIYGLDLDVARDVAMILPLPVARDAGEAGLRFVDLSGYPELFRDLGRYTFSLQEPQAKRGGLRVPRPRLPVHQVGAFEASFVPGLGDMDRLDPRFRIPGAAWDQLPSVADFGFAVFKLRAGKRQEVHPMALRFRVRDRERLFFPTVHIHDGSVHPRAEFRHALYSQGTAGDMVSPVPARDFVAVDRCAGLVDPDAPVASVTLWGERDNVDTWLPLQRA